MIKTIIMALRVLACICTLAAVKEAADKHAWPLIIDLVTALFLAVVAWCIGGLAP